MALKKKLAKSHEANNKRCLLVLDALLECDGEDPGPSGDWISSGLIHVNNVTFELYLAKNSKRDAFELLYWLDVSLVK